MTSILDALKSERSKDKGKNKSAKPSPIKELYQHKSLFGEYSMADAQNQA